MFQVALFSGHTVARGRCEEIRQPKGPRGKRLCGGRGGRNSPTVTTRTNCSKHRGKRRGRVMQGRERGKQQHEQRQRLRRFFKGDLERARRGRKRSWVERCGGGGGGRTDGKRTIRSMRQQGNTFWPVRSSVPRAKPEERRRCRLKRRD